MTQLNKFVHGVTSVVGLPPGGKVLMSGQPSMLFWGNCQARHLCRILKQVPYLTERYELAAFEFTPDPITGEYSVPDPELLSRCEWLYFNMPDNRLLPDFVHDFISKGRALRFPVSLCPPLWPQHVTTIHAEPGFHWGRFPYGDLVLLDLIEKDFDDDRVLRKYLQMDFTAKYPLARSAELWRYQLDKFDAVSDVKIADFVWSHFQRRQMFWTIYHATNEIFGHVLRLLFKRTIGDGVPEDELIPALRSIELNNEMTPIHPSVVRYFNLTWVTDDLVYNSCEGPLRSEQWYAAYLQYIRARQVRAAAASA